MWQVDYLPSLSHLISLSTLLILNLCFLINWINKGYICGHPRRLWFDLYTAEFCRTGCVKQPLKSYMLTFGSCRCFFYLQRKFLSVSSFTGWSVCRASVTRVHTFNSLHHTGWVVSEPQQGWLGPSVQLVCSHDDPKMCVLLPLTKTPLTCGRSLLCDEWNADDKFACGDWENNT